MKTHYDIIGVPFTATQEQIVTAYRLRSKVLHPDRFDPSKQPVEWELANELLKELNGSYAILRDPTTRADYDRAIGVSPSSGATRETSSASSASQSPPRTSPPPQRPSVVPPLASGWALYRSLSATLQTRMRERCKGKVTPQFRARVGGVVSAYVLIVVVIWAAVLSFSSASAERWNPIRCKGRFFGVSSGL